MKTSNAPRRRVEALARLRPTTSVELHRFVERGLGLRVGTVAVSANATPPFAYLEHSYFERGDCVVWANRGGGKTMLGAVATLLDLLFKPGIQVRILGASLEQSTKMYEHLTALLEKPLLREGGGILAQPPTTRRVVLAHGSRVELLAGSQRSVRGVRVHKLRCDEVEEFDPAVWEAAQLVTRSGICGETPVRGSVEALSTMHKAFGLMSRLVEPPSASDSASSPARVFRWNALDVVARCPDTRPCEGCLLWNDCGGRAKQANGFVPVEDLITQRQRSSDLTWRAEMLCQRPGVQASVFPNFDPTAGGPHVTADDPIGPDATWYGGMDFGLRGPHVMLWIRGRGVGIDAVLHVVDEYHEADRTVDDNVVALCRQQRRCPWLPDEPGALRFVGADPAGHQRNRQTGLTDVAVVRRAGYRVLTVQSRLRAGLEVMRRRLDRRTLTIHPRCVKLIRSLTTYRFDPHRPERDEPLKDGADHACDALRYLLMCLEQHGRGTRQRAYW